MRRAARMALPLLLAAPGCALIDGIRGGDEQILPPECEPYCFVTIDGGGADGPTALTRRDNPFDFLIGDTLGDVVIVSPQDAAQGGFGRRLSPISATGPVVDITAGNFENGGQNDVAISMLNAPPEDFDTPIFFNDSDGAANETRFPGDAATIGDIGLIVACDVRATFTGDELVTFHSGTANAWEISRAMPAPGGLGVPVAGMEAVAAACGDFDKNGGEDLAILSKDANGDRLIVLRNDLANGIGNEMALIAPLPPQSGRNTRARALRYNAVDNVIAVGFACDDCTDQPWSIIREYEVPGGPNPQLMQVGAVEFVAPFETLEFTTGDFDGDADVDYAVGGAPLGPVGPDGPPPNLVLLFDNPALLPHPIQVFNLNDTTAEIIQIEAGPINNDGPDDIALITATGGGGVELKYLLTTDSGAMGPTP